MAALAPALHDEKFCEAAQVQQQHSCTSSPAFRSACSLLCTYSVAWVQDTLAVATVDAAAAEALASRLPCYADLIAACKARGDVPAWLSDPVLAAKVQFLMSALAPCCHLLPQVGGVVFKLFLHRLVEWVCIHECVRGGACRAVTASCTCFLFCHFMACTLEPCLHPQ